MQYLRQSTVATVKLGPFVDDTDGKTAETGLTIQKAHVRLAKNGGAFAAASADQGASDVGATHDEGGEYAISLNATDTATVGRLKARVHVVGALPVWREFTVLEEAIYDALFADGSTGLLPANVTQWLDVTPLGLASQRVQVFTAMIGAAAITQSAIADGAISEAKAPNLDAAISGRATASQVWAELLANPLPPATYGKLLQDFLDAAVSSRAAPGDQMDLIDAPNETARHAIATTVESHLLDEGDSQMLINAIVGAIGNVNIDEVALVAAIRADLERTGGNLNTVLARLTAQRAANLDNLDTAVSSRLAAGAYTAPDNTGIAVAALAAAAAETNTMDLPSLIGQDGGSNSRFTAKALELAPTGSGGGGAGTGANIVTITVDDGASPLEGARVRVTHGAESYVVETDVGGVAVFSLDDATWTVSITKPGYQFAPTTLAVSGVASATYSMSQVIIPPSDDPAQVTGFCYVYDETGEPEQGADIYMQITKPPETAGLILDFTPRKSTSGVDGLATFTGLFKGATYRIWRGSATRLTVHVTIPQNAADPYTLRSSIGSP